MLFESSLLGGIGDGHSTSAVPSACGRVCLGLGRSLRDGSQPSGTDEGVKASTPSYFVTRLSYISINRVSFDI